MGKRLSNKYGQKLLDSTKHSTKDAIKRAKGNKNFKRELGQLVQELCTLKKRRTGTHLWTITIKDSKIMKELVNETWIQLRFYQRNIAACKRKLF